MINTITFAILIALNLLLTLVIAFVASKRKYKLSVILGLVEVFIAILTYYSLGWGI